MKKFLLLLIVFFSVNAIAAELKTNYSDYESKTIVAPYDIYAYDITNAGFKYRSQFSTLLDTGFGDFIKIDVYNYCSGNLIYSEYRTSGSSFGTVSISPFQLICSGSSKVYYANIEYSIMGTYGNYYFEK